MCTGEACHYRAVQKATRAISVPVWAGVIPGIIEITRAARRLIRERISLGLEEAWNLKPRSHKNVKYEVNKER